MKRINQLIKNYLANAKIKREEQKQWKIFKEVCERSPTMKREIEAIMFKD